MYILSGDACIFRKYTQKYMEHIEWILMFLDMHKI